MTLTATFVNRSRGPFRRIIPAALVAGSLLLLPELFAQNPALPASVSINTDSDLGAVDPLLRPSTFAGWASPTSQSIFFGEIQSPGVIRMHVESQMTNSTSLADYKQRLQSVGTDWKTNIEARGGTVIICMARMPRWLSSKTSLAAGPDPGGFLIYEAAPPRDYNAWAQLVSATVQHFSVDLGLKPYYELWNEPDLPAYWSGSTAEYFKLYRYFVAGARSVKADAKVGGPTASGLNVKIDDTRPNNLMTDFLNYCATTPLPQLGYFQLPVDFVSIHQYGSNPWVGWKQTADSIRTLFATNGLPTSTPIMLDEWNYQGASVTVEPKRDAEYGAAFLAATLPELSRSGFTGQSIAALEDYQGAPAVTPPTVFTPFHGDFGIMTNPSNTTNNATVFRKASYNAVKAFDYVTGGRKLTVSITDNSTTSTHLLTDVPMFSNYASKLPNGDIAIVLWNHIASVGAVGSASIQATSPADLITFSASLATSGQTADQWFAMMIANPGGIDSLNISTAQKAELHTAVNDAAQSQVLATTPIATTLTLTGSAAARTRVQHYVVDAAKSNSYPVYTAAVTAGQTADQATAAAHAQETLQLIENYPLSAGQAVTPFSVAPYSVHLLILSH